MILTILYKKNYNFPVPPNLLLFTMMLSHYIQVFLITKRLLQWKRNFIAAYKKIIAAKTAYNYSFVYRPSRVC